MVVELALRRRWEVQRQLRVWLPKILQGLPALLAVARLDCVQLRKRRSVVPSIIHNSPPTAAAPPWSTARRQAGGGEGRGVLYFYESQPTVGIL